ncbi:radical SAM protein [Pseudomonas aeruginosa]|nr:radical SAM protein [Pseudomonas aeruginosa]KSC77089.1 radical SAM protein [Pseudomonas aeruginosa]MBI6904481.1 radical SAM protein [Pseudomonas aeruginosa]
MHKARTVNQANVSITATRWCNRRCTHCYIDPKELANRSFMQPETFKSIFPRMRELLALDKGLEEIEWELIGGEITSLPVEYWQENLPFALDQCADFNKVLKTPGSINVLSNLIFADEKRRSDYLDLFAKYGDRQEMCLYTSWEPETNRFGKNMALFDRWKETVREAGVRQKILDVILTRTVVDLGPEYLLETFLPLGIKDFSIKMISPFGSGRTFWQPNMVEFERMSDYLIRLFDMVPEGITFTPADEMSGAVFRGTSYQCIGNFRYDLAIEPDGLTTFNANQTTDEASLGSGLIYLDDPDWSWKVLSDNTQELDNKLSAYHDYCFQCEFHSSCAGGWYHYRTAAPEDVRAWDAGDCPGYKKLWIKIKNKYGAFDRPVQVHREEMSRLRSERNSVTRSTSLSLEPTDDSLSHAQWLKQVAGNEVQLLAGEGMGKPLVQRMWAYQAVGCRMLLTEAEFVRLTDSEQRTVVEHLVYDDFFALSLGEGAVWSWCERNPADPLANLLVAGAQAVESGHVGESLIAAGHNTELLRWVIQNPRRGHDAADLADADPVIRACALRLRTEARFSGAASSAEAVDRVRAAR